jgi:hypothetical protein
VRFRAVPRGTPDPDGERRYAERPFPLLEPVEWTGERHRSFAVEVDAIGIGPGDVRLRVAVEIPDR